MRSGQEVWINGAFDSSRDSAVASERAG